MAEDTSTGISRRDLLKRGAALGGAVMWATPVVQTLGMGRAFAQTASPPATGQDISYIGINVDCPGTSGDYFVKWEDDTGWENKPGKAPQCSDSVFTGMNGGSLGFNVTNVTGPCAKLTIPSSVTGCTVTVWVKAGQTCNTYSNVQPGTITVCSAP